MLSKIETRKIVPVVAKISAGKSKLLNVIYNINYLECKAGIGTKFINLLRYNPNIKKPQFYHLNLLKEGENYFFLKDMNEFYEGEEEIIEANKKINEKLRNEKEIKYENIFYMLEINEAPFIEDKEYLLTHDLCDVPGLSEDQSAQIKQKNNEVSLEHIDKTKNIKIINKDIYDEKSDDNKMFELENLNEKQEDDIYFETKKIDKNTYLSEIFGIIKNYIDGAIIIFSVENYYFEENFELIAKLHRVIQKKYLIFW